MSTRKCKNKGCNNTFDAVTMGAKSCLECLNKNTPKIEIKSMHLWQSKILNAVAWIIGIRGEDAWIITISKDLVKEKGMK
jgi:hypothetical protein